MGILKVFFLVREIKLSHVYFRRHYYSVLYEHDALNLAEGRGADKRGTHHPENMYVPRDS